MTLPNQAGGLSGDIEWLVQFGDGSIQGLPGRIEDVVVKILKQEVKIERVAWHLATEILYDGLERAIPFVLSLIQALIHRLFNNAVQFLGVQDALNFIEEVPILNKLVNALTGKDGGLEQLGDFIAGKWTSLDTVIGWIHWIRQEIDFLLSGAGLLDLGQVGTKIGSLGSDLQSLIDTSVGHGGSGFPWTFPVTFGTGSGFPWTFPVTFGAVVNDIEDVGRAILNAPQKAAELADALVQELQGVLTDGHSLADVRQALQQLLAIAKAAKAGIDGLIGGVLPGGTAAGLAAYLLARLQHLDSQGQYDAQQLANIALAGIAQIDDVVNGILHTATSGNLAADLKAALQAMPHGNVIGTLGPANIGDALTTVVDTVYAGAVNDFTQVGKSLAQLGSIGGVLSKFLGFSGGPNGGSVGGGFSGPVYVPPAGSVAAITQTNDANIANRAVSKPTWQNVDQTLDGSFNLSSIMTNATLPTLAVGNGSSVIGMIPTPENGTKESIAWIGNATAGGTVATTIPFFGLNLYQMNLSTGVLTLIAKSGNIASAVLGGSSPVWNYWDIPVGNVQTIDLAGSTGGSFTLTGASTTSALAWNAAASTVQTAIEGLSGVGAGNVLVTATPTGYRVAFIGTLVNTSQSLLVLTSSLTGNNGTPVVSDFINVAQGDVYAVELDIAQALSNTYTIVGVTNFLPSHPTVFPAKFGATRAISNRPTYGATGAGKAWASGNNSYTHTLLSTDNYILVWGVFANGTPTVTVGGVSATLLNDFVNYTGTFHIGLWGLVNPPTGAQTVAITAGSAIDFDFNSVSYGGVSSVGTPVTTSGTGTSVSQTVTSGISTDTIAQAFASSGLAGASLSAYNQTSRWNQAGVSSQNQGTIVGDAPGSTSVSFTATNSSAIAWGAMAIPLHGSTDPAPTTISSPTYSNNTPWFGLSGSAIVPPFQPLLYEKTIAGSDTYSIPAGANNFDIIVIGGGGGGGGDVNHTTFFSGGGGGNAGIWTSATLTKAQMTNNGAATTASVSVGAGGTFLGGAGSGSSVVVTGYGTLSSAGASGGGTGAVPGGYGAGASPGNVTVDGNPYIGGAAQGAAGGGGNSPGGGGAGGYSPISPSSSGGGPGAPGAVYILAY